MRLTRYGKRKFNTGALDLQRFLPRAGHLDAYPAGERHALPGLHRTNAVPAETAFRAVEQGSPRGRRTPDEPAGFRRAHDAHLFPLRRRLSPWRGIEVENIFRTDHAGDLDDGSLVDGAQRGEKAALEALIKKHHEMTL